MTKNTLPNLNPTEKALILRILDAPGSRLSPEAFTTSSDSDALSGLFDRGLIGYLDAADAFVVEDARVEEAARQ